MHTNQTINICFTGKSINIFIPLFLRNVTDSESLLSLVVPYLVHDLWFDEDESFNLLLKSVYAQIKL